MTTKLFRFDLPFIGFYQSEFEQLPFDELDYILDVGDDDLAGVLPDDYMYEQFDWAKYYDAVASLYAGWVFEKLGFVGTDYTYKVVSPKEYNFINDIILVQTSTLPEQLSIAYFTDNGMLDDLQQFIRDSYTSRDGFISFVEPNPDLQVSFFEYPYLSVACYMVVCKAFGIDYNDDDALSTLNGQFVDWFVEGGYSHELVSAQLDSLPKLSSEK